MPANKQKKPHTPYHHGDLRAALIAEARKLVEQEGPDAVSLRAVAKAARVSQAAPYHHFKDKHALLAAVAAQGFREFKKTISAHAESSKTARDKLNLLGVGYIQFAVAHPLLFRLMQGPTFQSDDSDAELAHARAESVAPLIEAVTECLPGADEKQIMTVCAGAWSIVHGAAVLCNDNRLGSLIDTSDTGAVGQLITNLLDIGTS